jgi:hypothetical protein
MNRIMDSERIIDMNYSILEMKQEAIKSKNFHNRKDNYNKRVKQSTKYLI